MSRRVTLSTGRVVGIDSDGIADITSRDFRLLSPEDQEFLNAQTDRESFRSSGRVLGRCAYDCTTGREESDV